MNPAAATPANLSLRGAEPTVLHQRVASEIDEQRRRGSLREVVIPPAPDELVRLRQALAAATPDLNEVARIATRDVALSAVLLRHANSALITAGPPVQTVGAALNRIGLDAAAALMTACIVRQTIPADNRHLLRFWQRSGKRTLAMSHIAGKLPGMSVDVAATFGLFCHIGFPVLLQCLRGYGPTLVEAAARTDRSFVATENANHRTDHAVAGALLARAWKLAPEVVSAIRLHHELPSLGRDAGHGEVRSLVAAGLIAEHLMRRHEGLGPEADWRDHGAEAMEWLQVRPDELVQWEDELLPVFDEQ